MPALKLMAMHLNKFTPKLQRVFIIYCQIIIWTQPQQTAFNKTKRFLSSSPFTIPTKLPNAVAADASSFVLSIVWLTNSYMQFVIQSDDMCRPVANASQAIYTIQRIHKLSNYVHRHFSDYLIPCMHAYKTPQALIGH